MAKRRDAGKGRLVGQGSYRTVEPRSKEVKFYSVAHGLLLNAQAREYTSVFFYFLGNYDDFICLFYLSNEQGVGWIAIQCC
jgi:hypothetical protein